MVLQNFILFRHRNWGTESWAPADKRKHHRMLVHNLGWLANLLSLHLLCFIWKMGISQKCNINPWQREFRIPETAHCVCVCVCTYRIEVLLMKKLLVQLNCHSLEYCPWNIVLGAIFPYACTVRSNGAWLLSRASQRSQSQLSAQLSSKSFWMKIPNQCSQHFQKVLQPWGESE